MLSIIIPAYNAEEYLEACVQSVLSGKYRDFEILLIDDGSEDNTGVICDRLAKEHPQLRVFHTENRGLPSARNLGIEYACGAFIGFADADDLVMPDMFQKLVESAQADVQLAACRFRRCHRADVSAPPAAAVEAVHEDRRGIAERILRGGYGPYVWNKLYRRSILNRYGIRFLPQGQGSEDLYFNMQYLQHCDIGVFLNEELYCYIITDTSITETFRRNRVVCDQYTNIPRSHRYAAETMESISEALTVWQQARAVMFYQTILRKLETPSDAYIHEAVSYVKQHRKALLCYRWGIKYYLSALVLGAGYPLWAKIFRRGV